MLRYVVVSLMRSGLRHKVRSVAGNQRFPVTRTSRFPQKNVKGNRSETVGMCCHVSLIIPFGLRSTVWWHGQPTILKRWFDRDFVNGGLYASTMRYDRGYCGACGCGPKGQGTDDRIGLAVCRWAWPGCFPILVRHLIVRHDHQAGPVVQWLRSPPRPFLCLRIVTGRC